MAEPKDDGGAAYPRGDWKTLAAGMSLRDKFADSALRGIVEHHKLNACGDFVGTDGLLQHFDAPRIVAQTAYQFADAMLVARKL